jgi:hypothetical protein
MDDGGVDTTPLLMAHRWKESSSVPDDDAAASDVVVPKCNLTPLA